MTSTYYTTFLFKGSGLDKVLADFNRAAAQIEAKSAALGKINFSGLGSALPILKNIDNTLMLAAQHAGMLSSQAAKAGTAFNPMASGATRAAAATKSVSNSMTQLSAAAGSAASAAGRTTGAMSSLGAAGRGAFNGIVAGARSAVTALGSVTAAAATTTRAMGRMGMVAAAPFAGMKGAAMWASPLAMGALSTYARPGDIAALGAGYGLYKSMGFEREARLAAVRQGWISNKTYPEYGGLTGAELRDQSTKQMKDLASQLALSSYSAYGPSDIMQSINEAAALGISPQKMNAQMVDAWLNFSKVAEMDTATSAKTLFAQVVAREGLSGVTGGNFEKYSDYLSTLANISPLRGEDLTAALKKSTPVASAYGQSIESQYSSIAALSLLGMQPQEADAAYRRMLLRLTPGWNTLQEQEAAELGENVTKTGKEKDLSSFNAALKGIGLKWEDVMPSGNLDLVNVAKTLNDKLKGMSDLDRNAFLKTIAGIQGITPLLDLMQNPDLLDSLVNQFEDVSGATKDSAKYITQDFQGSLEKLKAAADVAAIKVGNSLSPAFQKFTDYVRESIPAIEEFGSAIISGDWGKAVGMLENFVNNAAPVLANAFESLGDWIERGIDSVNWESAGVKIGSFINSGIQWGIDQAEKLPWEKIATAAGNALKNIAVSVDWASLVDDAVQAGFSIGSAIVSGIANSGIGITLQNIAIGFERSLLSAVGNFAASIGTLAMKLGMSPATLAGVGDTVRENNLLYGTKGEGKFSLSYILDRIEQDVDYYKNGGSSSSGIRTADYVMDDATIAKIAKAMENLEVPSKSYALETNLRDVDFASRYPGLAQGDIRELEAWQKGLLEVNTSAKEYIKDKQMCVQASVENEEALDKETDAYKNQAAVLDYPGSGGHAINAYSVNGTPEGTFLVDANYGQKGGPKFLGSLEELAKTLDPETLIQLFNNASWPSYDKTTMTGNLEAQYTAAELIARDAASRAASSSGITESFDEFQKTLTSISGDHRGTVNTGPGSVSERERGGTPSYSTGRSLSESKSSGGSGGSKKGGTGKSDPGFDYPDDYPLERLPPEIRAQREAALAAQEDNSGALITLTDQLAALPPRLQTALKADTLDYGNISNIMKEAFGSTLTSEELKNIDLLDEKTRDDLIAIASLYPTLPEYLKKIEKNTDEIAKEEKKTSEEGEKTSDNTKQTAENTKDTGPSEESKQLASLLQNTLSAGQIPGPNESTDPYDSKFYSSYIGPTSGYIPWLEQTGEGSRRISSWMLGAAGAINGLGLSSGRGQIPTGPYTTQEMINQAIVQVIPQLDSSELETLKDRLVNEGWNADLIINVQDAEAWAAKSALQQDTHSTHVIHVITTYSSNQYRYATKDFEGSLVGKESYENINSGNQYQYATKDFKGSLVGKELYGDINSGDQYYNIPYFANGGYTGEYEGLAYLHPHERVIPDSKAQYPSISLSIDLRGATITGDSADVFADKIASRVKEELHGEMYR